MKHAKGYFMIKKFLFFALLLVLSWRAFAQNNQNLPNLLFDDSDIIVQAQETTKTVTAKPASKEDSADALNSARKLLNEQPAKLRSKKLPPIKKAQKAPTGQQNLQEAPFGLMWGADITSTRNQGVMLSAIEMKDYVNCFSADHLPKKIDFFERVFVVFGEENELYRILAYSHLIDDDTSASLALKEYRTYSNLLERKYGNKKEDFTPAVTIKIIKNTQGKEEEVKEEQPIGNPDFLSQLQSGDAVLYSTYHDENIASALSIGVDGDKKSYIVIDYRNLDILKKQEEKTLDAL